jgi:hypothetical protein
MISRRFFNEGLTTIQIVAIIFLTISIGLVTMSATLD